MRLSVQCLGCFSSSVSCKPRDALIWLELDELSSLVLSPQHFQTGTCVAGEQCHFAHYLEDKPVKEQKKCAFFSTDAGCKLGDECKFAHIPEVIVEHEVAVLT